MNLRKTGIALCLWLTVLATSMDVFAQDYLSMSGESQSQRKELSDRFFIAFTSSTYLDIVTSKLETTKVRTGYEPVIINNDTTSIPRYEDVPVQSRSLSIVSFGLEARYNLHEMSKNAALAISVPISFGLGMTQPANSEVLGTYGLGAMQVPVLLKLYAGNHSTLETEKDFGVSVGFGLEYNKIGLINMSSDPDPVQTNGWILPVGTVGIHFWRGMNPFEINVKYGVGPYQEYRVNGDGSPIRDGADNPVVRRTRSSSFKVTFVTLLNY